MAEGSVALTRADDDPSTVTPANTRRLVPSEWTSNRSQLLASSSTSRPWIWYRSLGVDRKRVVIWKSPSAMSCIARAALLVFQASNAPSGVVSSR